MFIAWRCLYAAVVSARIEGKILKLSRAYACMVRLLVSRLRANGVKWYKWSRRTRFIPPQKTKLFPLKYRNRKLIKTTATAEYTINPILIAELNRTRINI